MNPKRIYRVGREGTVIGTFNEPELVYLVSCGKVLQDDDCWTDGMPSDRGRFVGPTVMLQLGRFE